MLKFSFNTKVLTQGKKDFAWKTSKIHYSIYLFKSFKVFGWFKTFFILSKFVEVRQDRFPDAFFQVPNPQSTAEIIPKPDCLTIFQKACFSINKSHAHRAPGVRRRHLLEGFVVDTFLNGSSSTPFECF